MACWLFKTEPDEFSIDRLAASPEGVARWDGIRNYQARNHLRDRLAPGDAILIYHSSCRVPGIAGTATAVSAGYPDPAQFDSNSPWFDRKSSLENPRWFAVDVRFSQRFTRVLPVKELRHCPELRDMVLFRQGRLSVQPVTRQQWECIVRMASPGS